GVHAGRAWLPREPHLELAHHLGKRGPPADVVKQLGLNSAHRVTLAAAHQTRAWAWALTMLHSTRSARGWRGRRASHRSKCTSHPSPWTARQTTALRSPFS